MQINLSVNKFVLNHTYISGRIIKLTLSSLSYASNTMTVLKSKNI